MGHTISYIIGVGLPYPDEDVDFKQVQFWRIMLVFPAFPMMLQTIMLFTVFTKETPKYLYLKDKKIDCHKELRRIFNDTMRIEETELKLEELVQGEGTKKAYEIGWNDLLGRKYRKAVLVVCRKIGWNY